MSYQLPVGTGSPFLAKQPLICVADRDLANHIHWVHSVFSTVPV